MPKTRVLVVDDGSLYRKILVDIVNHLPDAVTVGSAIHGQNALKQVERLHPDLVLLDVEMPVMDGLTTLRILKARHPKTQVVMVSGTSRSATDLTVRALEHGAVDFIEKPSGANPSDSRRQLTSALVPVMKMLRADLRASEQAVGAESLPRDTPPPADNDTQAKPEVVSVALGGSAPSLPVAAPAPTGTRTPRGAGPVLKTPVTQRAKPKATKRRSGPTAPLRVVPSPADKAKRADVPRAFSVLAIGTSTGGPAALAQLIPKLPKGLPVPVLVVQHMPPGFTESLATRLDAKSQLQVKEAHDNDILAPGGVLIAPGGRHMVVEKHGGGLRVRLQDSEPVKSCRPSVDVLLQSLVAVVDRPVLSVIMTGMGDDGADGVQALTNVGSYNLAQDQASSVVFGMPRAVVERGLQHEVIGVSGMAARVCAILGCGGLG